MRRVSARSHAARGTEKEIENVFLRESCDFFSNNLKIVKPDNIDIPNIIYCPKLGLPTYNSNISVRPKKV